jgi:cell division protein FtsW (lipid II flippase)
MNAKQIIKCRFADVGAGVAANRRIVGSYQFVRLNPTHVQIYRSTSTCIVVLIEVKSDDVNEWTTTHIFKQFCSSDIIITELFLLLFLAHILVRQNNDDEKKLNILLEKRYVILITMITILVFLIVCSCFMHI